MFLVWLVFFPFKSNANVNTPFAIVLGRGWEFGKFGLIAELKVVAALM